MAMLMSSFTTHFRNYPDQGVGIAVPAPMKLWPALLLLGQELRLVACHLSVDSGRGWIILHGMELIMRTIDRVHCNPIITCVKRKDYSVFTQIT